MPWRARRLLPQVGADVAGDGLGDAAGELARRFGFPREDERFHQRLQPGRWSDAEAMQLLSQIAHREMCLVSERLPVRLCRKPPLHRLAPCQSFEGFT